MVSYHSRRSTVQRMSRAHQTMSSIAIGAGPDAHDVEVDLLERRPLGADLDDVAAGRDQGADDVPGRSTPGRRRRPAARHRSTSTAVTPSIARTAPSDRCVGGPPSRTISPRAPIEPRSAAGESTRSRPPRTNAIRSHSRSASSRLCVASTIVRPGPTERLDRLADDERGLRIERRGRLVEEHDRRVVEQRPGDRQLLLHALAERAGHVVAPVPQVEQAQVALDALGAHGRRRGGAAVRRSRGWPSPSACRTARASRSGCRPGRGRRPAARGRRSRRPWPSPRSAR